MSIISSKLMKEMNLEVGTLSEMNSVRNVGHEILFTYHILKGCVIRLGELKLKADLIVLETNIYDLILGMDWLVENQVVMDCQCGRLLVLGLAPIDLENSSKLAKDWEVEVVHHIPIVSKEEYIGLNENEVVT